LPRDRDIHVICRSGGRAYYATRILLQNGFKARTLAGGMLSHLLPTAHELTSALRTLQRAPMKAFDCTACRLCVCSAAATSQQQATFAKAAPRASRVVATVK
jgi:hypothetical protein